MKNTVLIERIRKNFSFILLAFLLGLLMGLIYVYFLPDIGVIPAFILSGLLIGIIKVVIIDNMNISDEITRIEDDPSICVLGAIPWLDKKVYNHTESLIFADDTASFYTLSYQKIISSIKIHSNCSNSRVIGFTSTGFSKKRSSTIMNIAYGLNKTGESVIVLDADFRTPSLHNEFGICYDYEHDLSSLMKEISNELIQKRQCEIDYLPNYTQNIVGTYNLNVITNHGGILDTYEYVYSPVFSLLIEKLKQKYDWVLLDMPPVAAVPDALTLGSYADGIVLISTLKTNILTIKKLYRLFNDHHINILGVVLHKVLKKEVATTNKYIKQIISNMIQQDENVTITQ